MKGCWVGSGHGGDGGYRRAEGELAGAGIRPPLSPWPSALARTQLSTPGHP